MEKMTKNVFYGIFIPLPRFGSPLCLQLRLLSVLFCMFVFVYIFYFVQQRFMFYTCMKAGNNNDIHRYTQVFKESQIDRFTYIDRKKEIEIEREIKTQNNIYSKINIKETHGNGFTIRKIVKMKFILLHIKFHLFD